MQMSKHCAHCGQELPEIRAGVRLPALKARIFDAVARAGRDGIDGNDLFDLFLKDRGVQRNVLKVHIYQINEFLVDTNCTIATVKGRYPAYRLRKAPSA
jgi:DNA-binding winged helix-turn-helix (wHTH) protein